MNRHGRLALAAFLGMSMPELNAALADQRVVLPPAELFEAHNPDLVRPDGSPLFGPPRDEIIRAILPGFMSAGPFLGGGGLSAPNVADVFATSLYTGNNANRTITTGFQPDMVWTKGRSHAQQHGLVRRAAPTKFLTTNNTDPESNGMGGTDDLTGFTSTGYTLGTSFFGAWNANAQTFASWSFKKAAGFYNEVTWTGNGVAGRSISHGLGVAPGIIIIKCTSTGSTGWVVYHRSIGATKYFTLNSTGIVQTYSAYFNDTEPSASSFTLGDDSWVNGSGQTYIAYLFAHDPTGIIQCGSYTGNGSTTGPIINLGWDPQYVLIKNASGTGGWCIFDTARTPSFSGNDALLTANTSDAENANNAFISLTGTGFQMTTANAGLNGSGSTYIYKAIKAP